MSNDPGTSRNRTRDRSSFGRLKALMSGEIELTARLELYGTRRLTRDEQNDLAMNKPHVNRGRREFRSTLSEGDEAFDYRALLSPEAREELERRGW